MAEAGVFPCDVLEKYIHLVLVFPIRYQGFKIREMKVFEESEIGQQVAEPLLVTQVTEESGTWSNISYDDAMNNNA